LERENSGLKFAASRARPSKTAEKQIAQKARENLKSQVFTPWLASLGSSAQGYMKFWREEAAGLASLLGP
jgi:hypothetical protein